MEETMNMSKLDLTRERSRNDETSFMRPATPLKNSQVINSVNKNQKNKRFNFY